MYLRLNIYTEDPYKLIETNKIQSFYSDQPEKKNYIKILWNSGVISVWYYTVSY